MKIIVLSYKYSDGSSYGIIRAFLPEDKEQADQDLMMMQTHGSDSKTFSLLECDIYQPEKLQSKKNDK